jgi:hypothetical protein
MFNIWIKKIIQFFDTPLPKNKTILHFEENFFSVFYLLWIVTDETIGGISRFFILKMYSYP